MSNARAFVMPRQPASQAAVQKKTTHYTVPYNTHTNQKPLTQLILNATKLQNSHLNPEEISIRHCKQWWESSGFRQNSGFLRVPGVILENHLNSRRRFHYVTHGSVTTRAPVMIQDGLSVTIVGLGPFGNRKHPFRTLFLSVMWVLWGTKQYENWREKTKLRRKPEKSKCMWRQWHWKGRMPFGHNQTFHSMLTSTLL